MTNRERLTEITEQHIGTYIVLLHLGRGILKLDLTPGGVSTVSRVTFTDQPVTSEIAELDGPPQIEIGEPLLVFQDGGFVMLGTTSRADAKVTKTRTIIWVQTDARHQIKFIDQGYKWTAEFRDRPTTEQEKDGPYTYRLFGITRCREGESIELDVEGGAIRGVVQMVFQTDGPDRSVLSPRFLRYFEGGD